MAILNKLYSFFLLILISMDIHQVFYKVEAQDCPYKPANSNDNSNINIDLGQLNIQGGGDESLQCDSSKSWSSSSSSSKTKHKIPSWGNPEELSNLLKLRETSWTTLLDNIASPIPETKNKIQHDQIIKNSKSSIQLLLRNLNLDMRHHYHSFIANVGHNLYPLIIASDNEPGYAGVGSTFKLYLKDGTIKSISAVPLVYERNKALTHITVTLFSIVSPYFKYNTRLGTDGNDNNDDHYLDELRLSLKIFMKKLNVSYNAIKAVNYEVEDDDNDETSITTSSDSINKDYDNNHNKARDLQILQFAIEYIQTVLTKGQIDIQDFIAYTNLIAPLNQDAMKQAADAQVKYVYPALQKWKNELGPELWSKVYVLIPTVWSVAETNPRQQIIEKLMDPSKIKTNIIMVENSPDEEFSRKTLGRVVGDRSLAHIVWGVNSHERTDHLLSLLTRRDLLSTDCDISLNTLLGS